MLEIKRCSEGGKWLGVRGNSFRSAISSIALCTSCKDLPHYSSRRANKLCWLWIGRIDGELT